MPALLAAAPVLHIGLCLVRDSCRCLTVVFSSAAAALMAEGTGCATRIVEFFHHFDYFTLQMASVKLILTALASTKNYSNIVPSLNLL